MKAILLATLVMSISTATQATSIVAYKLNATCFSADRKSDVRVVVNDVQIGKVVNSEGQGPEVVYKDQEKKAQLILKLSVQEDVVKIQARKVLPPKKSAGTPLKYTGVIAATGEKVELAIGTRPVKVGTVVGKISSLTVDGRLDKQPVVCVSEEQ